MNNTLEMVTAHFCLQVEILEVVRVLPDVDTDDRDMGKQRVLVGGRRDFESFLHGMEALPLRIRMWVIHGNRNGSGNLQAMPSLSLGLRQRRR